ncbi:MAG: cereblon family protein [Thermodesulfobacteriota bacterium]
MQVSALPLDITPGFWFRVPPGKPDDDKAKGSPGEKPFQEESDSGEAILCGHCHQVLTDPSERIRIQGAHRHTFANPHGIVFQIGCFRSVRGCGQVGPATSEWSWFKGYSWRILVCRMCLTHLGWLYTSAGDEGFSGLILDRIIESKEVSDG